MSHLLEIAVTVTHQPRGLFPLKEKENKKGRQLSVAATVANVLLTRFPGACFNGDGPSNRFA